MTPFAGSGEIALPGDYGHLTYVQGLGRGVTLETVDM